MSDIMFTMKKDFVPEYLAYKLVYDNPGSHEEMSLLIKAIDERIGDWEFTEGLYAHFAGLHEQYLEEVGDEG